jgi:hypothetical protein
VTIFIQIEIIRKEMNREIERERERERRDLRI